MIFEKFSKIIFGSQVCVERSFQNVIFYQSLLNNITPNIKKLIL